MTQRDEELRRRLEQAGITQQPQQPVQPAVTQKTIRKVQRHVLGGPMVIGQPDEDVEEIVQNEAGTELRHTRVTGTCPCGGALDSAKKSYCGVCGYQLCPKCSSDEATCALDQCGKHICRPHRVSLAQGIVICATHIGQNTFGNLAQSMAMTNPMTLATVAPVAMLPQPARPYPQVGEGVDYHCPHCGCQYSVTAMIGSQQQRCTWCNRWYTVSFAQDFGGALRVDVLAQ
ncbi:MAG: hypothetical protein HW389_774 [Bacteroidetes bacterium]|nr:hypothetical protein [Bacteroidota bacterium]